MTLLCPYCGNPAELVTGADVYPHREDLHLKKFWRCSPCKAYVGCHAPNKRMGLVGTEPLGRLANDPLRKAKRLAHAAFDPLWKEGQAPRSKAYGWLSQALGLPLDKTHIGEFDESTCLRVVALCRGKKL